MTEKLLTVTDLAMRFRHPHDRKRTVHAVDGITFSVEPGEIVGVVGESGSGKSTIGRCILGLEDASAGTIEFESRDITHASRAQRRRLAKDVQVVFQDPYSSLNPFLTIGQTMCEPYIAATGANYAESFVRARMLLERVGLPADAVDRYPRQFSGGQRQRVAIARALMLAPKIIVCDEAVSALDLSTQAQVLNLLRELAEAEDLAYLFIAHDLDVVHYIADRTVVLYRGRIMEQGDAALVHSEPLHPYTIALLASAPVTEPVEQARRRALRRAAASAAKAPSAAQPATGATGCPFAARCAFAEEVCLTERPADLAVDGRTVACHAYDPASGHSARGVGIRRLIANSAPALTKEIA